MMLAQLLQMAFFGGLAVSLIGRGLLPEPYSKFIEANQMVILGVCFLCNIVSGNLLNTGAFEVAYNGHPVWSKIETGRFPQMDELRSAMESVMQAALPVTAEAVLPESFGSSDL
jgi:selT/selW/selH-like putative selenoprotein